MKRFLNAIIFGWFVVLYSGQSVAGPFTLLSDCSDTARFMATQNVNVSTVCQYKN